MSIENFTQLLKRALEGEVNSLLQWNRHYREGHFTEGEITQALNEIQKILTSNPFHGDALTLRAYMYSVGQGSAVNFSEAIAHYEAAIKIGNTNAMINRANMYNKGQGSKVDYQAAMDLYNLAIDNGSHIAFVKKG